jgi:hypothetical protein
LQAPEVRLRFACRQPVAAGSAKTAQFDAVLTAVQAGEMPIWSESVGVRSRPLVPL